MERDCNPGLRSGSAAHYQQIYRDALDWEARWAEIGAVAKVRAIDHLTRSLPRPFSALCEMGCGTGAVLGECMLRGMALKYLAVDASAEALAYVRTKYGDRISTIQHDLETGPPDIPSSPEVVVLSHLLEHLLNPTVLLSGLSRMCQYVVAEVPLEKQPVPRFLTWFRHLRSLPSKSRSVGHVQFFSVGSFRDLLEASGWRILADYLYSPYASKEVLVAAPRHYNHPVWPALLSYYMACLLGRRLATRLLCAHYAVLASPVH